MVSSKVGGRLKLIQGEITLAARGVLPVSDNTSSFGGDPTKVTFWGESARAKSIFQQMAVYAGNTTYKGKPLFRAGIMNSGSIFPADPVDYPKEQQGYDIVVASSGCISAKDTLDCLPGLDYDTCLNAANFVPEALVQWGYYAKVPFIIGDQEDEGTLFSLEQSNFTTTAQLKIHLSTIFFHSATPKQIRDLVETYPDSPSAGPSFRTGSTNEVYPQ
ncbi:Alpha/Beta hydrolase protein [Calycina marina]|uniref:Alpha/Beta hydrolase protein n=1 Tax=Calycina marina TaxID=1763456 RepID=A0A9P8CK31_9HELO|nr:Alpha/Beta hydrolase protein [Calycina marina]